MAEKEKAAEGRKVRVLVATADYQINDTPFLTASAADAAVREGWGDDNPEAVAYAESIVIPAA